MVISMFDANVYLYETESTWTNKRTKSYYMYYPFCQILFYTLVYHIEWKQNDAY